VIGKYSGRVKILLLTLLGNDIVKGIYQSFAVNVTAICGIIGSLRTLPKTASWFLLVNTLSVVNATGKQDMVLLEDD
jgi:hypothetical protein